MAVCTAALHRHPDFTAEYLAAVAQGPVSRHGSSGDRLPGLRVLAGVKGGLDLIRWIKSALNGRSPGA